MPRPGTPRPRGSGMAASSCWGSCGCSSGRSASSPEPSQPRSHAASRCSRGFPDESLDRLLRLFASLPEDELASTIEAISRVSPGVARRVLSAADRVARLAR